MLVRFRAGISVVALAIVAGACGGDSSTAPGNTAPVTLDQALSELSIPAVSYASGASYYSGVSLPALVPSRCTYTAASQSFVCTPISANGLTINQSFTLLAASGAKQAAFDAATTAAVRVNTTVAGTLSQSGTVLAIDGRQELTLSGLISGPHTLNGTSTSTLKGDLSSGTTSYPIDLTVSTTITNLVLPANASSGGSLWPTSGAIAVETGGTVAGLPSGTTKVTITFSGTSTVNIAITGPGGYSRSCTVDLAKGDPAACS
jgi:hypothetical protein